MVESTFKIPTPVFHRSTWQTEFICHKAERCWSASGILKKMEKTKPQKNVKNGRFLMSLLCGIKQCMQIGRGASVVQAYYLEIFLLFLTENEYMLPVLSGLQFRSVILHFLATACVIIISNQ